MSADRLHSYKLLAELCDYPTARTAATARLTAMFLEDRCPEAASAIRRFVARVDGPPLAELEERYSAVFDFHPARTLDLGYQLFGETYKRGVFLVRMKEAALAHAIDTAAELPDHLPNVLRLLADLAPEEAPRDLAEEVVLPALARILSTFEDDGGGYRDALSAVKAVLMSDFDITRVEMPRPAEDPEPTGRRLPVFPGFNPPSEGGSGHRARARDPEPHRSVKGAMS